MGKKHDSIFVGSLKDAIIIVLLIIAIIVTIFMGIIGANKNKETEKINDFGMGKQDIEIYNSEIQQYIGEDKTGEKVKELIHEIINNNDRYVCESGMFISIHARNIENYNSDKLDLVCKKANVYEIDGFGKYGDNDQENTDFAKIEMRALYNKIDLNKKYNVTGIYSQKGKIYGVTILEK